LTADELAALRGIDRTMLDFFASSLKSKRKKRLQRVYPMTFSLPDVDHYYQRFCQLYMAKPHTSSSQDAIDFGYFLEDSVLQSDDFPAYSPDLVRFERLSFCAHLASNTALEPDEHRSLQGNSEVSLDSRPRLRSNVVIGSFHYDVTEFARLSQTGPDPMALTPVDGYTILIRELNRESGLQMFRINNPTKLLLDMCDGRQPLAEVGARAASALGASLSEEQLLEVITRLHSLQLIDLSPGSLGGGLTEQTHGAADMESL
jgi:hypothetical protein